MTRETRIVRHPSRAFAVTQFRRQRWARLRSWAGSRLGLAVGTLILLGALWVSLVWTGWLASRVVLWIEGGAR